MDFRVIIPVRYSSTRLPGKALLDIAGKPMIQHVYERAVESHAESVVIATDSEKIREVAEDFGAEVCMTSKDHQSGTERLSEAVVILGYDQNDIVVNLQGDNPFIPASVIRAAAEGLERHDNIKVATVCETIKDPQDIFNPAIVKVVLNHRGFALYFSRAPIPWDHKQFPLEKGNKPSELDHYHRHVGLYAYRVGFLEEYLAWTPSPLEAIESLEQLRVLWHGGRIYVAMSDVRVPPSVDTAEELEAVRKIAEGR